MEVVAVSLNAREQRTLRHIADELAVSDPKPASILGIFNRLAWGEAMPARQPFVSGPVGRIRARSPWARLVASRSGLRLGERRTLAQLGAFDSS
jgi:hypothetical protein